MDKLKLHRLHEIEEIGFFQPRSWAFWRVIIVCFCVFSIVGHWLEIPYCLFMDHCFGIVADDYAVWSDPWYHPYWVYGFGAVVVTLVLEPFKSAVLRRRKTVWGAFLETFAYSTLLAMVMELVIGWLVNQPDAAGVYPYWDNSQMPFNVFGQAWLVNDVVIGLVAVLYIWVLYPLVCELFAFAERHGGPARREHPVRRHRRRLRRVLRRFLHPAGALARIPPRFGIIPGSASRPSTHPASRGAASLWKSNRPRSGSRCS